MILPEHKARIQEQLRKQELHEKPTLAEDEIEDINRVITESIHTKTAATFTLYDPLEDYELTGIVSKIDRQLRRIKVEHDDEVTWVPMEDILKARIQE
jgi:hypothetical protein